MPDISVYDSRSDGISFSFINMPKTQKTGKMLTTIDLFHLAPVFLGKKFASEKIFSQVQPIGFTREKLGQHGDPIDAGYCRANGRNSWCAKNS